VLSALFVAGWSVPVESTTASNSQCETKRLNIHNTAFRMGLRAGSGVRISSAHVPDDKCVCTYSATPLAAWAASEIKKAVQSFNSAFRALRMLRGSSIPGQHYLHALLKKSTCCSTAENVCLARLHGALQPLCRASLLQGLAGGLVRL
jgi:hypothetical protein